jgi:hypothetical protein
MKSVDGINSSQDQKDLPPCREELVGEVNYLRSLVADLSEQREDDRRSILILQNQIDNLHDTKCSDSLESSLRNISLVCQSLWNRIPPVQVDGIINYLSRRNKKKSGKKSSRSSVTSSSRKLGGEKRMTTYTTGSDSQGSIFQLNKAIPRGS